MEDMGTLKYLPVLGPMGAPRNIQQGPPGDATKFLANLRAHVRSRVQDAELLQERKDLWKATEPDASSNPPLPEYWYLRGKTEQSHDEFLHWVTVIKKDLKCDPEACGKFVTLFGTQPPKAQAVGLSVRTLFC